MFKRVRQNRSTSFEADSGAKEEVNALDCLQDDKELAKFQSRRSILGLALVAVFALVIVCSASAKAELLTLREKQHWAEKSSRLRLKKPLHKEGYSVVRRDGGEPSSSVQSSRPLIPRKYAKASARKLWKHLKCEDYFEHADRPTDHKPIWDNLRRVYVNTIHPEASVSDRLLTEPSAMQVPYSVRKVKGKGLGLYARETIPKGAIVDDYLHGGRLVIDSGEEFRRFFFAIQAKEEACLVLQCMAIETTTYGKNPRKGAFIAVDLDDSCFMNTADEDEDANVRYSPENACTTCDYASREIKAGEEIFIEYGDYVVEDGWDWFSL